jgi:Zn-finger nucleic acid-binding protein
MNCTSCNKGSLKPSFIDGVFRAHTCSHCKGDWILIENYVAWKEKNPNYEFADNVSFAIEDAEETKKALICPMSGQLMQKIKLSANNDHRLDYSVSVGGIWLDNGEWELLKSEGLAGSLNRVVTRQWQNQIRQDSAKQTFTELYQERFGSETYLKIKEVREWLDNQPKKSDLRNYLLAEDPYSADR